MVERMTKHEITISEQDAKDAVIHINIAREGRGVDSIFTVRFLEEDGGSLYLEVTEDSNPTESIANNYPEFFTLYHTHGLTTTVDGELI